MVLAGDYITSWGGSDSVAVRDAVIFSLHKTGIKLAYSACLGRGGKGGKHCLCC